MTQELKEGAGEKRMEEAAGHNAGESEAATKEDESARVPDQAAQAQELAEQLRARQTKQEFYWKRQAEKLAGQLEEARRAKAEEVGLLQAQNEEARALLEAAQGKAARLRAIAEAGLPAEMAALVPETGEAAVQEYIEKLKPLADKLRRGGAGGTLTNPARAAGGEGARLGQLAAAAKRGDKHALREYAHLRERVGGGR